MQDTMEDFWRPVIQEEYLAVRQPTIEANNFELKLALITMVQQNQFTGHSTEDSNEHMGRFLRMANTVKLNGVRPEKEEGRSLCSNRGMMKAFILPGKGTKGC